MGFRSPPGPSPSLLRQSFSIELGADRTATERHVGQHCIVDILHKSEDWNKVFFCVSLNVNRVKGTMFTLKAYQALNTKVDGKSQKKSQKKKTDALRL